MEFEQKAEEKKMSMSKNIARLAVTAGLTAALSFGGVMAPVTMAFAEGATTTTNSITINKIAGNKNVKYKAYQIFKAKVTDTAKGKTAQDITWANDKLGATVVNAIKNNWTGYNGLAEDKQLSRNPTAQEVADFLMAHAGSTTAGSADGSSEGTRLATDNVLYAVANAVKDHATAVDGDDTVDAWTFSAQSGSGYYLFVTSDLDATKPSTGTSPIFAIVGGNPVTVTEKTSIPTINKEVLNVKESKDGYTAQKGWNNVADSQVGQEVSYKLTGSIADNYATYDSYAYKFTDTLSQGLTYVDDSLEVYALNDGGYTKISPNSYTLVEPTESNNVLTVNFDKEKGLKSATAANADETLNIGAETKIVVFYKAKLNSKASYEATGNGNKNEVYLEYSNNPMAGGTGKSETKVVTDYVFGFDVTKVDEGTGDPLKGDEKLQAGFKVRVVEGDEDTLKDKWLGANGEIVDSEHAHEFMTKANTGKVFIPGLDAGTYEITETTTPSGYNTIAPFQITVKPDYDTAGNLTGLTVSDTSNMVDSEKTNASIDSTKIPVTIKNKKGSGLPLTGLNGVTFTWIAGGAVLCIGVAHLIRGRKRAEESEQE